MNNLRWYYNTPFSHNAPILQYKGTDGRRYDVPEVYKYSQHQRDEFESELAAIAEDR